MAKLMIDYLDDAAAECPDQIAFTDENNDMSFLDLQTKARSVAQGLLNAGIRKQPVAIYMEKSVSCIAAMLGVLYSGNFYTVLDTHMPQARIEKILDTLNPAAILASQTLSEAAGELTGGEESPEPDSGKVPFCLIYEEQLALTPDLELFREVRNTIIEKDVMYVLFTSGSTGTPKGVVTSHYAVVRYMEAAREPFHMSKDDIAGNQTPFYFVFSLLDIYGTIYNKSRMYIIPQMYFSFPALLMKYIEEKKINILLWVPSALCMIANLKAFGLADISSVTRIIFGGEVMPIKQLNAWREELPECHFINAYGPTEGTDTCTCYEVDREFALTDRLPIGVPISNTQVMVLDEQDRPVIGKGMGELCVRGDSLAYGYYNMPEKTAEVFVQNPLNPHFPDTIYRTGDLVEYNAFGELEYAGRKDFQIKHMGHRIELGEIEANVSSLDDVEENACFYDTKKQRIVLYYSGKAEEKGIKESLKALVPDYMIPGKVIRMNPMPHNLNGKVDRAALKAHL